MNINELKGKLTEIEKKRDELKKQYEADLNSMQEQERLFIESYLDHNAKYQPNEKVLKKDINSKIWKPCFIGWRDINKKTWDIEYYTHFIKKDGSPSKRLSTYPCSEKDIKP